MNEIICPACKKIFNNEIDICDRCEYPFNGTEKEKSSHIGKFVLKKGVTIDSEHYITKSQEILYGISIVTLIWAITIQFIDKFILFDLIINLIICGVLFWCGHTIQQKPFKKVLIALSLFLGVQVLNFLIDPYNALNGALIKLAIIIVLGYCLYLIKSSEKFKKKYQL